MWFKICLVVDPPSAFSCQAVSKTEIVYFQVQKCLGNLLLDIMMRFAYSMRQRIHTFPRLILILQIFMTAYRSDVLSSSVVHSCHHVCSFGGHHTYKPCISDMFILSYIPKFDEALHVTIAFLNMVKFTIYECFGMIHDMSKHNQRSCITPPLM